MKNKGIIPINKPEGWTSFDVVNKLKYKLKPLKVGHLGTLDPMATGVLLVTIGKATKLFDLMQEKKKTYVATFEFGYLTDTLDKTGQILQKTDQIPTIDAILQVLPKFIGKISQIPPKYSAKSINGKRAYEMARQNIDFELKPKEVEIFDVKLLSYVNGSLTLEITCGSGTYIRSIGRDIASELKTLATMTHLIRTKVGSFSVDNCLDIQNIENIVETILPLDSILTYERLNVTDEETNRLLNGQTLNLNKQDGMYSLFLNNDIIALVKICDFKAKMHIFLG